MKISGLGDVDRLPGSELVACGLDDLAARRDTPAAALVGMAAPRLRRLGVSVPDATEGNPGHRLYELLAEDDRASAHSRYNALVGRMVSFVHAADRARAG